jgi:hypothetical protein
LVKVLVKALPKNLIIDNNINNNSIKNNKKDIKEVQKRLAILENFVLYGWNFQIFTWNATRTGLKPLNEGPFHSRTTLVIGISRLICK